MNPFFNSHRQNQQQGFPKGYDLNYALNAISRYITPTGMSPEQIVRQLIQTEKMSPEQFNQYSQIADKLTGGRR